jgi:hypothetical protein
MDITYTIAKTKGGKRITFNEFTMNLFQSANITVVIDFIAFFLEKLKPNAFIHPNQEKILNQILKNYNLIKQTNNHIHYSTYVILKSGINAQLNLLTVNEIWNVLSYFYYVTNSFNSSLTPSQIPYILS